MDHGPWVLLFLGMAPIRTVAFVDGFNLYHAIRDLGREELKWVNLRAMLRDFALPPRYDLTRVLYFTAHAKWLPGAWARHRQYVSALKASGVEVHLASFKKKQRGCNSCGQTWTGHEEKETDVNIGCHLLDLAYQGEFDRALLVSGDSDLTPAVRLVRARFPAKEIKIIGPPGRPAAGGLVKATGLPASKIKLVHVERSLLPARITDKHGRVVATRPPEYDPAP